MDEWAVHWAGNTVVRGLVGWPLLLAALMNTLKPQPPAYEFWVLSQPSERKAKCFGGREAEEEMGMAVHQGAAVVNYQEVSVTPNLGGLVSSCSAVDIQVVWSM